MKVNANGNARFNAKLGIFIASGSFLSPKKHLRDPRFYAYQDRGGRQLLRT